MRQYTYMNTSEIEYSNNEIVAVDIQRTGYITDISCLLQCTVKTAAATVNGQFPDNMARLIKSARLYSGATNFFSVNDGREWFWDTFMHYGGRNLPFIISATAKAPGPANPFPSAATTYYLPLRIHLGSQYRNPYDPEVVIPARELSQLKLEVQWGGDQSDFDSDATPTFAITSAKLSIMVNEIQLEPGETREAVFPAGTLSPRMEANTYTPPSTAPSNLAWKTDVPVGDTIVYSLIIVLDNNVRSDSVITEVGIEIPKMREKPWRVDWLDLVSNHKLLFDFPFLNDFGIDAAATAHPLGVALFPWSYISGKSEGLDLSAFLPGDVKMSFSGTGLNVSQDKLLVVHYMVG